MHGTGLNSPNLGRKLSARVNTRGEHKSGKIGAYGLGCFFNMGMAEEVGTYICLRIFPKILQNESKRDNLEIGAGSIFKGGVCLWEEEKRSIILD